MRIDVATLLLCLTCACHAVDDADSGGNDAASEARSSFDRCVPPTPTPAPIDGGLPAWAVGDFHDDAPDLGDAVNLRVLPASSFAWSISGCDVFGGDRGSVEKHDAGELVLVASDGGVLSWMKPGGSAAVSRATLRPADGGGGLVSETDAGVVHWAPGFVCGCAPSFHVCACDDPMVYGCSDPPPPSYRCD